MLYITREVRRESWVMEQKEKEYGINTSRWLSGCVVVRGREEVRKKGGRGGIIPTSLGLTHACGEGCSCVGVRRGEE